MRAVFRQAFVLVIVAAVAALVSAFFHPSLFAPSNALASDETTWAQVAEWRQQAQAAQNATAPRILILDARSDNDYRAAHVPGALPLNEPHWEQLLPAVIEALGNNTRIVVYCDDRLCEASRGVATRLRRELGLAPEDVFVLKGGWGEWLEWQQTHPAPPATTPAAPAPAK